MSSRFLSNDKGSKVEENANTGLYYGENLKLPDIEN